MGIEFSFLMLALLVVLTLQVSQNTRLKANLLEQSFRLKELRNLLSLRSKLAKELAHEIKNPLAAIQCSAETMQLLANDNLTKDQQESLVYIKEYSSSLGQLLQDYLDLSMVEAGELKANLEDRAILPIINSVLGLLKAQALRKNIKFELDCSNDNLSAKIDERHFKQVIFNLVHNACKFSAEHSKVKIQLGIVPDQDQIFVKIVDHGEGISEKMLKNIFNPYKINDDSSSFTGHRIGLALSKELLNLSNASIHVDSAIGLGTTFEIRLIASRSHKKNNDHICSHSILSERTVI